MSDPGASPRSSWFFWFALACAALMASAYVFAAFSGGVASKTGWNERPHGHTWLVASVNPQGPAAGKLVPGDQVLAINGSTRAAEFGPAGDMAGVGVGNSYRIQVRRDGAVREYSLQIVPAPELRLSAVLSFLVSALLFAVGLWIGLMKPRETATRVGFGAFLLGSLLFWADAMSVYVPSLNRTALFTAVLIAFVWRPFHLALGYDFVSRFPVSVPEGRLWRTVRVVLYALAVAFWIPFNLTKIADAFQLSSRSALLPSWFPLQTFDEHHITLMRGLYFAATAAMGLALVRNYRMLPDADARRRMRWACLGVAVASVPYGAESLVRLLLTAAGRSDLTTASFFEWADSITMALTGLSNVILAYAIVKHRVLGIRVVIRRGVQYLLAKNVLRVILFSPVIILGVQLLLHPESSLRDVLLRSSWPFYVLVVVTAGLSLRYRGQLSRWVDRKFFRNAYNQEEILVGLIEKIKSNDSIEEVSATVAHEIDLAFHPASICIAYRKDATSRITLGYPVSSQDAESMIESLTDDILSSLEEERAARTFSELESVLPHRVQAPPQLRDMLLVPMAGTDQRLGGVLMLGPKRSEESYTKTDRDLLQAIAGQIAVVSEVLSLKERMREEHKVRVEVLGRLDDRQINLVNECPSCGTCYDRNTVHCIRDNALLTLTLPVERVIEGKYRLDRRIGTGGMGAVFEAQDLRLSRSVAVKIMTGRLFGNRNALRRFEREARAAAKLEHPNIVPIFDYGKLEGGGAFLVMPVVRGRSWRNELKHPGGITPDRAASWLEQLCSAVAAAHQSGVVHRDLKPENVIISREENSPDRITVLDFGLAKVRAEEPLAAAADAYHTSFGVVLGTAAYMSPEQRAGSHIDARTDIYAIGLMAVETLTGHRPPTTGASREWMDSVLNRDLLQGSSESQERLRQLLMRCLAPQPESRFTAVSLFQVDLANLMRECQPLASVEESDDSETMSLGE